MKQNEKVLREKIDTLTPLSGGIVFGKEDAWEKLQARMEAKPARKIALGYRLAAAAILLIITIVAFVFNYDNKQVTITKSATPPAAPVINTENHTTQLATAPETTTISYAPVHHNTNTIKPKAVQPAPVQQPAIVQQAPQQPSVQAPVNVPQPEVVTVAPLPTPMKVVHINEVSRNEKNYSVTFAGNAPAENVQNLPVVHINHVEREAVEIRTLLKENRMTLGRFPFKRPAYPDVSQPEEYQPPHNFIKDMFNPQN